MNSLKASFNLKKNMQKKIGRENISNSINSSSFIIATTFSSWVDNPIRNDLFGESRWALSLLCFLLPIRLIVQKDLDSPKLGYLEVLLSLQGYDQPSVVAVV